MRNPDRLDDLYKTIHDIHKKEFPDLRFGQLMSVFMEWCVKTERCSDMFYPEDDKWLQWFKEYSNYMKKRYYS